MKNKHTPLKPGQCCPHCGEIKSQSKPFWWHWFLVYCPNCKSNTGGQMPVRDDIGEDCNLFEKVDRYNSDQRGDAPEMCECGAKLEGHYRHALADWNCLTRDGEPFAKAPLLPNQGEGDGTFMDEAEYEKALHAANLEKQILANLKH